MNNLITTEQNGRKRNDYGIKITYFDGSIEEFRIVGHTYLYNGIVIEFCTTDDEIKQRITDKIKAIDFDKDIHKFIEKKEDK